MNERSMSRSILISLLFLGILIFCNTLEIRKLKPKVKTQVMPSVVYLEILCVVDYSTYELHGKNTAAIREYFSIFWNIVDQKFRFFNKPEIRISLAGFMILQTENESAFLKNNRISSIRNGVDANAALDDLGKFLYEKKKSLPSFDIAVAVTNMNMVSTSKGGISEDILGLAFKGRACSLGESENEISSAAMIEDSGAFSGLHTVLHEISHLLDASHDNEPGQEMCNDIDGGFVMESRKKGHQNQWQWSSCSTTSIRNFTNQPEATCLYNVPTKSEKLAQTLPGVIVSLNEQCFKRSGGRVCAKYNGVCSGLYCTEGGNPFRCSTDFSNALDGSPCELGQHCMSGKCVKQESSVVVNPKTAIKTPDIVYLEILCIVDYDTFKLHGSDSVAMKEYLSAFWTSVDLKFKTLDNPQIRIHLAGIITLKPHEATFLENNRIRGNPNKLDEEPALLDLSKFLYLKKTTFPPYDIAIVIRKLDMIDLGKAGRNELPMGITYDDGACFVDDKNKMVHSAAIAEDSGSFDGVIRVTRLLGRLLNVPYDYAGEIGNCPKTGFIMGGTIPTQHKWSSCSKEWLSNFLKQPEAACLYNVPTKGEKLSGILPGKILSLDKQCARRYNAGRSCEIEAEEDVCTQLYCTRDGQHCRSDYGAADGSPCGTGSICMYGRCVKELPSLRH